MKTKARRESPPPAQRPISTARAAGLQTASAIIAQPSSLKTGALSTGWVARAPLALPAPGKLAPPTIHRFEQSLYAVHATNHPPVDGVLRVREGAFPPKLTSHVAFGQVVPPHADGTWEAKEYVVMFKVKDTYSHAVNFMAMDTALLGDFPLPSDAILVAPKNKAHGFAQKLKVVTYDPATTTLRQATHQALQQHSGDVLEATSTEAGRSSDTIRLTPARGLSEGEKPVSVNTREFFDPLLRKLPGRSFGTHNMSVIGEFGRLGQLDYWLQMQFSPWKDKETREGFEQSFSTPEQAFWLALAETNFSQLDAYVRSMKLPDSAMNGFTRYQREMQGWMNILDADFALRTSKQKTLLAPLDERVMNELTAASQKPAALAALVAKHEAALPAAPTTALGPRTYFDDFVQVSLQSLKLADLPNFEKRLEARVPGIVNAMGGSHLLKLTWLVKRHSLLKAHGTSGEPLIASERLREQIQETAAKAMEESQRVAPENVRARASSVIKMLSGNAGIQLPAP